MFGVMQPKKECSVDKLVDANYVFHRMHYCGTCKAIGNQFDQSSRMLLNFDAVFLSELLSLLNKEDTAGWEKNLKKVNTCFSMPKEALPFSLEYSAATNVLLGELKIDDNIKDNKGFSWKLANQYFSNSFKEARSKFESWSIDLNSVYDWIQKQEIREKETQSSFESIEACLDYYAAATASITGIMFAEGGKKTVSKVDLYDLGYQFGKLMYILDAFEDYEKDVFTEQFNPLSIYWSKNKTLASEQLEKVRSIILTIQDELFLDLEQLPIAAEFQELYKNRLQSNLALRLYKDREVPQTWKERIVLRWNNAKEFADRMTCTPQTWVRQLNYYTIVLAVFVSPNTSDFLPQDGKVEVLTWTAVITAALAGMGLVRSVRKNRKERRKEKKKERATKKFWRRFKRIITREQSCCGDCLSSCCSGCCDSCCNSCCDTICESKNPWFWILIILAIVLLVGLVCLILFLAGVI